MDGPTAQIAALVIAGNHWLRGGSLKGWYPGARVFNFCKFVHFITLSGDDAKPNEHPYADDPEAWLAQQRREGVVGFRLIHVPVNKPIASDRMTAGLVGGGGRKLIECVHEKTMDAWEAGWRVGDQKDPAKQIWHVNYARIGAAVARRDITPYNTTSLTRMVQDTLAGIAVFAKKHEQSRGWAETFEAAMACLKSKRPLDASFNFKGYEAMLPDLGMQRLIAAADTGWVFGAMGSWNDMGFDGKAQQEYEAVSDKLFGQLIDAITTAANSTFSPAKA